MNRGSLGIRELNAKLQAELNPASSKSATEREATLKPAQVGIEKQEAAPAAVTEKPATASQHQHTR